MDGLYTALGAVAFAAVGAVLVSRPGVRSWAASTRGRAWTRRVGALGVLVAGAATGVFPSSPAQGILAYFAAGVLAFGSASLAAAGAACTVEHRVADASLGSVLRAFWQVAATEFRVTRYGLAVAGVAFLLAALTGGVAVDATLSAVGALSFGGLLAVLGGLTAVGALVPGSGRSRTGTAERSDTAAGERERGEEQGSPDTGSIAGTGGEEDGNGGGGGSRSDEPPR
ncbi:hypothetical protein [Halobacterium rubrum]|uniref:hypothetical protein n=1 Tax=Halobacterium TaxID=2239 RepID=UPI001F36A1B0|nr:MULTISPECIES: hypothetical protein [Halobacterium]MDH5019850.1 hypothetical protein [Halobacterium rubrum]